MKLDEMIVSIIEGMEKHMDGNYEEIGSEYGVIVGIER